MLSTFFNEPDGERQEEASVQGFHITRSWRTSCENVDKNWTTHELRTQNGNHHDCFGLLFLNYMVNHLEELQVMKKWLVSV
jgi:hypothetical protein